MTCYLGIDLGTSAVKAIVVDEREAVLASVSIAVPVPTHPLPLASEQSPESWWQAVEAALDQLAAGNADLMGRVRGIGLSGQMHGLCLLDAEDRPVRPAMLWNDGRAEAEAEDLQAEGQALARQLGVPAMAGLTAPKLLWLQKHEPESLARAKRLLLPKDFVRLHLTGHYVTDVTDAAGTWLLDEETRGWSDAAIRRIGLDAALLPPVVESPTDTGTIRPAIAHRFRLSPTTVVAGGAGDTLAGGLGIGVVNDSSSFVALGTSGQVFVATERYRPAPEQAVHSFCHALPGRWCAMTAVLNGASALSTMSRLGGAADIATLLEEVEAGFTGPSDLLFLPYLTGERSPHNDPWARGVLFGLTPDSNRASMIQAVLEGVAFSLADGVAALNSAGIQVGEAGFIGGGARSRLWAKIIASATGLTLNRFADGAHGAAFGAARLGRMAAGGGLVATQPEIIETIAPDAALRDAYQPRLAAYRSLYRTLKPEFRREKDAGF
ncbi:xylulokinase [Acidisoma silvae]|uniref:Xylulose kinase n=1 Tax=Acidisoma silvae TaxID=2802396 RepID=A0A963YQV3_9PROT|nr:xylulokinase [Acidisoma silvae]MCB8875428.1 xylulokinase [Acidisoma silvae]